MKIHCENCHDNFDPTAEQLAFIEESAGKGMTFIMLECALCRLHTAYNPLERESYQQPQARALRLEKKVQLEDQPEDYQVFVARFDGVTRYELDQRAWSLYSAADLDTLIKISGMLVPQARSLAALAQDQREFFGDSGTMDEQGNAFDFERLERGFCIGEENGDVLFIDIDSGGVYCWHHDGGDVKRLADSFPEFLTNAHEIR